MTKPTPPNQKGRRQIKINTITQAQLIKLLLEGVYSCRELAEHTGLHYVTVLQYTRELHRAGAAHICQYETDHLGRELARVYKLGEGKDVKRKRKTAAELQRTCRARKRAANDDLVRAGLATYVKVANGRLRFVPLKGTAA